MNARSWVPLIPSAPEALGAPTWPDVIVLEDGRSVLVRPMRAEDECAEQAFVASLTAASRFRRFHVGLRELPPALLYEMTHVDQQRHVAFVAQTRDPGDSRIVADARYVRLADSGDADFAIAVADDWQRQGLGRALAERLLQHAREHGVLNLVGDVLWDNRPMLTMVRDMGGRVLAGSAGVMQARFTL
jgi:acetyltransferase